MFSKIVNYFFSEKQIIQTVQLERCPKARWGYNESFFIETTPDSWYTQFATNVPLEKIKNVMIEIGGQQIDKIPGDAFAALYKLYDIPEKNEHGNTIIPFYLSKASIPHLDIHYIKIHISYDPDPGKQPQEAQESYIIEAQETYKYKSVTWDNFQHVSYTHQIQYQNDTFGRDPTKYYLEFNHPVCCILVKDNGDTKELVFTFRSKNSLRIHKIKRDQIIGNYSVYKFADFKDYPNYTVFNRIDLLKHVDKDTNYENYSTEIDVCTVDGLKGSPKIIAITLSPLRIGKGMVSQM